MDQVVQVVAYLLVVTVSLRFVLFKFPFLKRFPFMILVYNIVSLAQVLALISVFFLLPSPSTKLQICIYTFVVIVAICVCGHVVFKGVMFCYMLFKYHNFNIAVSGMNTLVINGACYPHQNMSDCLVIKKSQFAGEVSYFWGDILLTSAPQTISYWSFGGPCHYKYHTKVVEGLCTFFIWVLDKPEKRQYNI